ncbi:MAG: adenine phosphoribosyltransferase, partial [Clostridia bacterium]|nr:adenine phosphoribosyltransferase [Clostridia bacterium]
MEHPELVERIRALLPSRTIGRLDLLPVFADAPLFDRIVRTLAAPHRNGVDLVAAPEAIGWILGTALAGRLGAGFLGIRKGGRLPYPQDLLMAESFTDYTGQEKTFEIPAGLRLDGKRVLVADEWIETGAQLQAMCDLLERTGA